MQPVVPVTDHNPNDHTDTEILAAIQGRTGVRHLSFRYELLDANNVKIDDLPNVESCTVEQNWLADIKRTASFRMSETTYVDFLSDRIKPWVRVGIPPYGTNDWAEWPQGVFLLVTPSRATTATGAIHRDVDGFDLLQVLNDDKVTNRYTVAAGTVYTTAISALLPSTATVVASTATVVTTLEWDPGTTKLTIINDLLAAINYETLSVDANGVYQARPYRQPDQRGAEYRYLDDDTSIINKEATQTYDLFAVPNEWTLTVSEPDRPMLRSTYTNTNPSSPTSVPRRGRTISDYRTEKDAADQATLDAKVARLAWEASQVYEAIDFETGINPLHSGNDVYRIEHRDLNIAASYVEHKWSLPFEAGAKMSHRARRVVSIA